MRLDARVGHTGFTIYDAKRCGAVPNVRWVDSDSANWGEIDVSDSGRAFAILYGDLPEIVHQEERISIYLERKLIIFNEVDLDDDEDVEAENTLPLSQSHREKVGA